MKYAVYVAALAQLAAAHPPHGRLHKRGDVVVYVTANTEAVVYVDQHGKPITTSYSTKAIATPAPLPVYIPDPAPAPAPAPVYTPAPAPVYIPAPAPAPAPASSSSAVPAPAPTPVASPAPAQSQPPATGGNNGGNNGGSNPGPNGSKKSIVYSPYINVPGGGIKNAAQINADFDRLSGYGMVRIYGTDQNQVQLVGDAAKAHGMKVFAGIYNIGNVAGEAQDLINYGSQDWSIFDTISVGNELVNSGQASPDQVIAALNQAKGMLRGAGYQGPVVTVDTFNAVLANPSLCHASDYAAANAHAFFDPTLPGGASGAGAWAKAQAVALKAACGKDVVITESGWPSSAYACNGVSCASPADQQAAISSLSAAFPDGGLILFSAFNALWQSPGSMGIEQSFGIFGNSAS